MIHWKTKEEMGNGFKYDEQEHKEVSYNSLLTIDKHEENTMRTKYLIRDVWSGDVKKLLDLKEHLDTVLTELEEVYTHD
tara:strand:- start:968 stop:1204 length:237 start_codon:yes stop_codon:yes gene_type:complete